MTLIDFLLARIAEDEVGALALEANYSKVYSLDDPEPSEVEFVERYTALRMLAECEAKRRIVDRHRHHVGLDDGEEYRDGCDTLRLLAPPYADHPDYRREWRP